MTKNGYFRIALTVVLAGLAAKAVPFLKSGATYHFTDMTSEQFIVGGARSYVDGGWFTHYGLPTYEGFRTETPIKKIQETGVYTHFLPGPDVFMGLMLTVSGDHHGTFVLARLLILAFLLFSLARLAYALRDRVFEHQPWKAIVVITLVALVPATYRWTMSIFGNTIWTACVFLLIAQGLRSGPSCTDYVKSGLWGGLALFMFLEGAFVAACAPICGALLCLEPDWRRSLATGTRHALAAGTGMIAIFGLHFVQVALFLGSLSHAWTDQIGTALTRGEHRDGPDRWAMFEAMNAWVRGHFYIGIWAMVVLGAIAVFTQWRRGRRSPAGVLAIAAAVSAGYAFPLLLIHHTFIHSFRTPRFFMLLFIVCWTLVLTVAGTRPSKST